MNAGIPVPCLLFTATTKEIKVIATDRFGKKYTSTHTI